MAFSCFSPFERSGSRAKKLSLDLNFEKGQNREKKVPPLLRALSLNVYFPLPLPIQKNNSYVKDFLKAIGPEGLPKLLAGFDDDGAYAQCVFAFAEVDSKASSPSAARVFVGRTQGSIARTPRGPRTFGWDCVFVPDENENDNPGKLTFAEMSPEVKNAISHRRRALDKLRAFLVQEYSS